MNRKELLVFKKFFVVNKMGEEPILKESERSIANFVYSVACEELHKGEKDPDNKRDGESDENHNDDGYDDNFYVQMEAAMDTFKRVIKLFDVTRKAKNVFRENFIDWSSYRERNYQRLNKIAEEIETYKYANDVGKVVGRAATVVGGLALGLSFLTPLAIVNVPLAFSGKFVSAFGGSIILGTYGVEIGLLKGKVNEAETLSMQDKKKFSLVSQWFTHTKELKATLESLVDYSLLKQMSENLKEHVKKVNLREGNDLNRFKQALKLCIGKMRESSNIVRSFGVVAPAVMTYVIVVCLLRLQNRIVLDLAIETERLEISKGISREYFTSSNFSVIELVVEILHLGQAFMDLYNRPEDEDAKKIREASERLEEEFFFIKSVYDAMHRASCVRSSFSMSFSDL